MMRLIKRGLMYGNLIEVRSAALVGRYNRALKHLTGQETALTEFHIDIAGYSPEIGHELEDELYLNPHGCNQQFILLTTDQKTAPLLSSEFSTSRTIIKDFIEDNEDQLFALTAREAVAGELMNSVFEIGAPKDLLSINKIHIEADTIEERVAGAKALQGLIEEFMRREDAWWDDVLIADMIELARQTGDIQRHPIRLKPKTYEQGNYYTAHFGGVYVFRDTRTPSVIARTHVDGLTDMGVDKVMTFEDRSEVAHFLYEHNLIELIVAGPDDRDAAIIKQKLDFIAIATAAEKGDDLGELSRRDMRMLERKYASHFPPAYDDLLAIWRWASLGGDYPKLTPNDDGFFYAYRATQGHDRDLVNMLLSELSPLDFRQLFICHKDAFYAAYAEWSEPKKEFVAKFLEAEYAVDKAGARESLFGDEPDMEEPRRSPWREAADEKRRRDLVNVRDDTYIDRKRSRRKRRDDDDDDDDYDALDIEEWRKTRRNMRGGRKGRKRR